MGTNKFEAVVLYVEDDAVLREQMHSFLKDFFAEIFVAKDGLEGLMLFKKQQITKSPVTLLITDIEMPHLNGFELIREIRKINSDMHAIITSGMYFGAYLEDMNSIDVLNDYVLKPIDMSFLFNTIKKALKSIEKRAEYKKQYSLTQQYKNALDNSAIISKTNTKGMITYVNEAFCEISGYSESELLGQHHSIVRDPDVSSKVFKKLWNTIRSKMIFKYPSLPNRAKDGTRYFVNTTIIPILNLNRDIIEFISVRFNTSSLENSILEERKAKESQRLFLANMSHEIRTPLNGILGFADILKQSDLDPQTAEYVNIINSSALTLNHTIDEILDLSKIQTGNMELENIFFEPYSEFKLMKTLFDVQAETKMIKFLFNFDAQISRNIVLKGDISKLKHIISNLLSNAMKFTAHDGTVAFDIILKNQEASHITLEFSIIDNGIGIDSSKQEDIFEPFIQAEQSTSRKYGGTGLGLSISKEITAMLGGKLLLESEPDKGSRFHFMLDFEYDASENICTAKEIEKTPCEYSGNILIAEDVDINRKLMEVILVQKGLTVTFAENGLECVEIFEQKSEQFDLIILDINMPIMDGIEALKQIKKLQREEKKNTIPIIALTANAIKGDREKFLSYGFDAYLSKPIKMEPLVEVLNSYLPFKEPKQEVVAQDSVTNMNNRKSNMKFIEDDFICKNASILEIPEEFYKELLESFLVTIDEDIEILEEALLEQSVSVIENSAHKLKGVTGNLHLDILSEMFQTIETDFSKETIHTTMDTVKIYIQELRTTI